ncbi:MAG TPA: hypothetical protein VGJ22_00650 [Anaerolineales bacterium]|jgi:hypothetical protein
MSPLKRALTALRWTRHSSILLGGFLLAILLIIYVWWPLAEEYLSYIDWHGRWWLYIDWLLIGIFACISVTIMARADLRTDALIVCVGILGGLAIESWGTQTNLWFYYTNERPPLWIIPAWPIAALAIDRLARGLNYLTTKVTKAHKGRAFVTFVTFESFVFKFFYWMAFASFLALMLVFVAPTFDKPYTILSLLLCIGLTSTPTDHRFALLTFIAGAGLGYFLELWGTTRQCWTYYTYETPPLFAVLAHGMAAVVFWRTGLLIRMIARALPAGALKSPVSE